jgi:alkylation response protein AidB-like acyl-CoA dehydrogenase
VSALDIALERRSTEERIDGFFAGRAADVDAGLASVRDGIRLLGELGLADAGIAHSAELIAWVARHDLASAFSAWAHRMALEYLAGLPASGRLGKLRAEIRAGRALGATALAAGTARHLAGTPLPITFRRDGGVVRLDGRVPWASNLLPPFVAITAASDAEDERRVIVLVLTDDTPGATVAPYPDLLALGATGSSSITLADARVPADSIIADDLGTFIDRVLPAFLILQSAFCVGLARAAIDAGQSAAGTGAAAEVLGPQLADLTRELGEVERRLAALAGEHDRRGPASVGQGDLLRLRLAAARLASDGVAIELAGVGGRGYLRGTATARRVREAAFLPIQSPTEVQLRWILSRSA